MDIVIQTTDVHNASSTMHISSAKVGQLVDFVICLISLVAIMAIIRIARDCRDCCTPPRKATAVVDAQLLPRMTQSDDGA